MKKQTKSYRYTLERCTGNRKKSICPNCGHRTFVRYIDVETGKPLGEDIGRCDREINCGYHKKPRDYFSEHLHTSQRRYWFPKKEYRAPSDTSSFSTIDSAKVEQTVMLGAFNNFSIWLREHFGFTEAMQQMMRYRIGTSNHWPNATIFWQIDQQQKVHTGKIMLYDYHTGHRVKEPYNHIAWVHKSENAKNFHLKQCLFGLHLLRPDTQIVAIVEAEKTAVVASIFFPDVLFLPPVAYRTSTPSVVHLSKAIVSYCFQTSAQKTDGARKPQRFRPSKAASSPPGLPITPVPLSGRKGLIWRIILKGLMHDAS